MKDFLQDLVAHTLPLDGIELLKITASDDETLIESLSTTKTVILSATTKTSIPGFAGVFGMPNLNKLDIHLKCPMYKENGTIDVDYSVKNDEKIPSSLLFSNETNDFNNSYRFMSSELVKSRIPQTTFKGAVWDIDIVPSVLSIQKLKFQANAHSEETVFEVSTNANNLIFSFGDSSTHAGSFIFEHNISSPLKRAWEYPVKETLSILGLSGDKTMKISNAGVMQITIDSGLAEYNYFLPANSK